MSEIGSFLNGKIPYEYLYDNPDGYRVIAPDIDRISENIPWLAEQDSWNVWHWSEDSQKLPHRGAHPRKRKEWELEGNQSSLEEAWACYQKHDHIDGIGFVFNGTEPEILEDFDDCINPWTFNFKHDCLRDALDNDSEPAFFSTSGTGAHRYPVAAAAEDTTQHPHEVYIGDDGNHRWAAVTGFKIAGDPDDHGPDLSERVNDLSREYNEADAKAVDLREFDFDADPAEVDADAPLPEEITEAFDGDVPRCIAGLVHVLGAHDPTDPDGPGWGQQTFMRYSHLLILLAHHVDAEAEVLVELVASFKSPAIAAAQRGDHPKKDDKPTPYGEGVPWDLDYQAGMIAQKVAADDLDAPAVDTIEDRCNVTVGECNCTIHAKPVPLANGGTDTAKPSDGGPVGPPEPTGPGNLGDHESADINPTQYFNDDGLFKAYSFARTLLSANTDGDHVAFATDEHTETMYYHNGRNWSPRGEQVVRKESRDILTNAASAKRVNEVVKNVKVQTYRRRKDILDLPPQKLVVRNGVVDLIENDFTTGWEHPGALSWVDVEHRDGAEPERFNEFLYDVLPADDVPILWEVIGLCLYRGYPFQRAVMLLGEGANGKSTLLAALRNFLGPENVASLELQHLARRFGAAELEGKLANLAPDISDKDLEKTSTFKALTGGDEITADRKHKTPVRFVNAATLLFSANSPPAAEDETYGYERRWLYFRFPNRFEEDDDDTIPQRKLLESFRQEHPGILNRATQAFGRLWDRGGFEATTYMEEHGEAVHERTTRPIAAFVQDELETAEESILRKREAYAAYREWADDQGHATQGKKIFDRHVRDEYACEEGKDPDDNRFSVWLGLRLVNEPDDSDGGSQMTF